MNCMMAITLFYALNKSFKNRRTNERRGALWLSGYDDHGLPIVRSNLLAAAVVPLGKALYPHCLVPRKGLKAVGPLVACL